MSITAYNRPSHQQPNGSPVHMSNCRAILEDFPHRPHNASHAAHNLECSIHERRTHGSQGSREVMQKIAIAARSCVRSNYVQFLKTNLRRWSVDGLWSQIWQTIPAKGMHHYSALQKVYSCICLLEMRIEDDAIRSRMAKVLLYLEYENLYTRSQAQGRTRGGQKLSS